MKGGIWVRAACQTTAINRKYTADTWWAPHMKGEKSHVGLVFAAQRQNKATRPQEAGPACNVDKGRGSRGSGVDVTHLLERAIAIGASQQP